MSNEVLNDCVSVCSDSMSGATGGTELLDLGASDADAGAVPTDGVTTDDLAPGELHHVWQTSHDPG